MDKNQSGKSGGADSTRVLESFGIRVFVSKVDGFNAFYFQKALLKDGSLRIDENAAEAATEMDSNSHTQYNPHPIAGSNETPWSGEGFRGDNRTGLSFKLGSLNAHSHRGYDGDNLVLR
jgi:hypothetical protein